MLRRLNETGRKTIVSQHYELTLNRDIATKPPYFELKLDLASYDFPPSAYIYVEAWRGNVSQRWNIGTVDRIDPKDVDYRRLTELSVSANFRITVVSDSKPGFILGKIDQIARSLSSLGEQSILPTVELEDMSEVWRLDYPTDVDMPVLQLNAKIENISQKIRQPGLFRSVVLPAVVRSILTRILLIDGESLDFKNIEPNEASYKWLNFSDGIVPIESTRSEFADDPENDRQLIEKWIDEVTSKFAEESIQVGKFIGTSLP